MELHHMSASEAVGRFARRELSPVELLDAVVARGEITEPAVNAITESFLEEAYAAARASEARYAEGTARPLEGVPTIIKEEQPIAGRTAEEGSLLEKGQISDITHPIVERIFEAGAVVHGRASTPEFCCAPVTHTKLWGVTRNPFNLEMSPGGSSGGSGAVLAAGSTTLATGSDIGGSIRIPSAYCGVVGFKPPFARVPGLAPFNSDTYCADGPMGRSVADVAMLQNVISGSWRGDAASLPKMTVSAEVQSLTGMRIALSYTLGGYEVDADVIANTQRFAEALRAAGATVVEVDLPWGPKRVKEVAWAHFGAIMGSFIDSVGNDSPERVELLMPYTRAFAESAKTGGDYVEGLIAESAFYEPFGALLEEFDALICPTTANTGFAADEPCTDSERVFGQLMTLPFNIVGRAPVLAVPSGKAANGVPTGVQIVGRTFDDQTVFKIGAAAESELALWTAADWWPSVNERP